MTTTKATRETSAVVRDRGIDRPVVVTILPNGTIGLRLKGCRRTFYVDAADTYRRAELKDAEHENGVSIAPRGRTRRGLLA